MKVVVGLGNPGAKYAGTRHNVGFEVVEYLAAAPGCEPFRGKFQSSIAEWRPIAELVLLVKPETFMNLSGRAVRAIVDFYKLTPADILVLSDDFNLPLGRLRARAKGSAGGQNGLKNIEACLGTDEYARLRIGVGQPGPGEASDFVLSRFKPGERVAVEEAVAKAGRAVELWIRQGLEACMNFANAGEKPDKPPPKPKPAKKVDEAKVKVEEAKPEPPAAQ